MPRTPPTPPLPPPDDDWLALDRQLCFALYAGSLAMTKAYRPLLADLGLTYPQYLVMLALWQHGTATVGALGEHLSLDSGTLTPLLKRLQSLGLVKRTRDAGDERRVLVALSADGLALKQRARDVPRQMACSMACDLAELQDLTTRLTALRQRLNASGANSASMVNSASSAAGGPEPEPAARPPVSHPAARQTGKRLRSSPP